MGYPWTRGARGGTGASTGLTAPLPREDSADPELGSSSREELLRALVSQITSRVIKQVSEQVAEQVAEQVNTQVTGVPHMPSPLARQIGCC